jgi:group II intron reverse transcriptase/maturase
MMNGREKSHSAIVAVKPTNKAGRPVAEPAEPRAGTKGNAEQSGTLRTLNRESASHGLDRVRKAAREKKKEKFTALLHHITVESLEEAFRELRKDAAPGVDGVTWEDYESDLGRKLEDLHSRVHRGAYRAQPSRRVYIPKPDGRQRPLAIAALEDKIVQRATATVLNALYEEDFLGFSYGFRSGRGQHDALDALVVGITSKKVNWILDADIEKFFDRVNQQWLMRFVEHRVGDKRILRLIQKWLKAGVLEDGIVTASEEGTGQGSVISPLLSNVYLHYAFDLWAHRWRKREATGEMIIVRYADDIIVGFQHEDDSRRFWDAMRERLKEFALSLHPDKTRLIEFGRFAAANRKRRGLGKPETFNFLGFAFISGKSRSGKFLIHRKSRSDRVWATLIEIKEELRRRMHQSIPVQGKWLGQVVRGWFNYHAVPTNSPALSAFRFHVTDLWRRTLRRRSDKDRTTWARMSRLETDFLPQPTILHPWPNARFAVTHPR